MLKLLSISNYALIESIEIEFGSGLNILTGETGAGKSIVIDALSLILGDRASTEIVRKGTDKAIVEGIFNIKDNKRIKTILEKNELDYHNDLILRREVSSKGLSRCFVNDTPVQLNVMKDIGDHMVDLHGQHEHQSLLRVDTHIDLLDEFGGLYGLLEEYRASYNRLLELIKQLELLVRKVKEVKEKQELYAFQLKEIDEVNPLADEEEQLENELRILENSEKLFEATSQIYQILYGGSFQQDSESASKESVYELLLKARNQLEDLAQIDKKFEEAKNECATAAAIVGELTKFVQSYNSKIEFDPDKLERIRERLGQLALLKKKYGGSIKAVVDLRTKISEELRIAENFDEEIQSLKKKISLERQECAIRAQRLSEKRRELVDELSKAVSSELAKLGIPNARFDVNIMNKEVKEDDDSRITYIRLGNNSYEATPKGIDFVEFYITTNIGEDLKPLAKVASGGEISRIMLALKSILAKADRLPILIFDEIDVGISGRIAQAVGKSLKELSKFHQIIAITHLPQIAGFADNHFLVEKIESGHRTTSRIRKLNEDERIREVARLLSGEEITEASLKSARELVKSK